MIITAARLLGLIDITKSANQLIAIVGDLKSEDIVDKFTYAELVNECLALKAIKEFDPMRKRNKSDRKRNRAERWR